MKRTERVLFVDASSGASGDMILGALVDLGVPLAHLRRGLEGLPISGWTLRSRKITRCGLAGRKVDVRVPAEGSGRGFGALKRIVERGGLSPAVRERSLAIFRRLVEAEAEAHGIPFAKVHLHEAGAMDAIIDVVGACLGLERLDVSHIRVSPMTTGFGTVRCEHGVYPVPGPATLALVRGLPVQAGDIGVERLTPTGAAILSEVADEWGELPAVRPRRIGYGAGDRDLGDTPNLLRMIVGDGAGRETEDGTVPEVAVLECTVDESTPQALAYAAQQLLEAGALDVFTNAVTMKKGRSGHQLTVLARQEQIAELADHVLRETSSLGLRYRIERRIETPRTTRKVKTRYGVVRVTVGERGGEAVQAWPEYEDCAALARKRGVPLKEVQQAALAAYRSLRRSKEKRRGR